MGSHKSTVRPDEICNAEVYADVFQARASKFPTMVGFDNLQRGYKFGVGYPRPISWSLRGHVRGKTGLETDGCLHP